MLQAGDTGEKQCRQSVSQSVSQYSVSQSADAMSRQNRDKETDEGGDVV